MEIMIMAGLMGAIVGFALGFHFAASLGERSHMSACDRCRRFRVVSQHENGGES